MKQQSTNFKNDLVSIVMCTYNGAQFLQEQLDSICNQTYDSLEIIINDDASTDGTWELLKSYAKRDNRIKLSQNEANLGFTQNFNKTALMATADIIAFSDQDDIWHEDKLRLLINNWPEKCPLIYCNSERFYNNKKEWNSKRNKNYRRFEGTDVRKISVFNTISGHALLIRRSLLHKVFPVKSDLSYDWYAGFVAACNGGVCYLSKTLVLQRVHSRNATVDAGYEYRANQKNDRFKKLVNRHLEAFLEVPELSLKYKNFIRELRDLWKDALDKKFSQPLFFFIAKYQKTIFWKKKKTAGIISRLKHTYRVVKN